MILRDSKTQNILKYQRENVGVQSKKVTLRMDEKTFDDFKEICQKEGVPYQTKMKDIMREYIDRVNSIYKAEEERNIKTKEI